MKRVFLIFLFGLIGFNTRAQTRDFILDSLQSVIEDDLLPDKSNEDYLLWRQANILRRSDYVSAELVYLHAIELSKSTGDSVQLADNYNSLGTCYRVMGNKDNLAVECFHTSRKINESLRRDIGLYKNYNNLGIYYSYRNNLTRAKESYDSAALYNERTSALDNFEDRSAGLWVNLAALYSDDDFKEVLDLKKADSLLGKALPFYLEQNRLNSIAGIYNNYGVIAELKLDYPEALEQFQKSKSLRISAGFKGDLINSYLNIGNVHKALNQKDQALREYHEGFKVAEEIEDVDNMAFILKNIIILATDEVPSARFKLYDSLQKTVFDTEKSDQIVEWETKYDLQGSENENLRLQVANEKNERAKNNIIVGGIIVVLLALIVSLYYQQRHKSQELKFTEEKVKFDLKVNDLLNQAELEALSARLEGQESERERISEDLHDNLGNLLTGLKLQLNNINNFEELDRAKALLDRTIKQNRNIAHSLSTGVLVRFGLIAALQELTEMVNDSKQITAHLECQTLESPLPATTELGIFRSVQELITNTLKHSGASQLTLKLLNTQNELNIEISDNGNGISNVESGNGLGLNLIKSRISKLKGKFEISSNSDSGTLARISLPYSQS